MKRFFLAALAFGFCTTVVAQDTKLSGLEKDSIVTPRSSEVYEIYNLFTKRLGLPNQAGHTMAAGVLTRCLDNRNAIDQVKDFADIVKALKLAKSETIAAGAQKLTPQMTFVAANLTCKKGTRTAGDMVVALETVYGALVADGWVDWLPNVVVASDLAI